MAAAGGQPVQVFGRRDSRATQQALRFFKERRVAISFVDIASRPPSPGELRRFSQRFGAAALVDTETAAFRDAGLAWLRLDEEQWLARLLAEPALLRLPLVRFGSQVTVGLDEATWKGWRAS